MNVTGHLYTQVYNAISGKFVELNSGYAISVTSRRPTNWGITPNLTGYNFPLPIITSRIEGMPILIGSRVNSGSGLYSVSIGMLSANNMSPNYANSGYLGVFNFGHTNFGFNAFNSYNIGAANNQDETLFALNLGFQNQITGSNNLVSQGNSNYIDNSNNVYLLGRSNLITKNSDSSIFGSYNSTDSNNSTNVFGNDNNLGLIKSSEIFGKNNQITGSDITTGNNEIAIFGDSNNISYSDLLNIFGSENLVISSSGNYIFGNLNSLTNATLALIVGNNNFSSQTGNAIFGKENIINGADTNVYGNSNVTHIDTKDNVLLGKFNVLSGEKDSISIGTANELTLGQGNVALGNGNELNSTNSSYIIGLNNDLDNSIKSYIFGGQNVSKGAQESYVLGQNNRLSGFRNTIIGNNNGIRSGDFNSIFIGVGHTPTGASKISSVTLAAGNTSVDIAAAGIRMTSVSRPTINNSNVVIQSDLGSYLNYTNGLGNSGVLLTNTFQDPEYRMLPDRIELNSFKYTGTETRYFGGFSGSGINTTYNFSGFFRAIPTQYYSGVHSVYGDYFYQSEDFAYEALFSRKVDPINGGWILGRRLDLNLANNLGIFYSNPSTDTGIFPINGWVVAEGEDLSGSALTIPSFVEEVGFTGLFNKKILNSSSDVGNMYFIFSSDKVYKSDVDGITVAHGNLIEDSPFVNPKWMIIDNYSSGIYYVNDSYDSFSIPQTGWVRTGFAGYVGENSSPRLGGSTGINIVIGSRQGYIKSFAPSFGNIYLPFYY